ADAEPGEGYAKCGAQRKGEAGPCTRPAGWGTDHPGIGKCKLHGGSTPTHQRAAELEIARRECDRLGIQIEVDPGEALMQELWETAGNVAFYRAQVQQLPTLYGRSYHVSGMPTGEAKPHVLVALYNEERKHLADVATAALRAGVEERRVRMA